MLARNSNQMIGMVAALFHDSSIMISGQKAASQICKSCLSTSPSRPSSPLCLYRYGRAGSLCTADSIPIGIDLVPFNLYYHTASTYRPRKIHMPSKSSSPRGVASGSFVNATPKTQLLLVAGRKATFSSPKCQFWCPIESRHHVGVGTRRLNLNSKLK